MNLGALLFVFAVAGALSAQIGSGKRTAGDPNNQYLVLLKRGPKWLPNKGAAEQPLLNHGHYLNDQMSRGVLQLAGPFLDDSGGLVLYNTRNEAEARSIAEHDPGVIDQILAIESIRPFRIAFDAATGKSPFKN